MVQQLRCDVLCQSVVEIVTVFVFDVFKHGKGDGSVKTPVHDALSLSKLL